MRERIYFSYHMDSLLYSKNAFLSGEAELDKRLMDRHQESSALTSDEGKLPASIIRSTLTIHFLILC